MTKEPYHVPMATSNVPRLILLIRHAEKPESRSNPNLSSRGYSRAGALPAWLTSTYEMPVAIYAMRSGSVPGDMDVTNVVNNGKDTDDDKKTKRPIQTITPYANECQLQIKTDYGFGETSGLVKELTSTPGYAGKLVVVCWVHGEIPLIAKELGCGGHHSWNGNDYDHIWSVIPKGVVADAPRSFGRDKSSSVVTGPTLSVVPQRLLFGDSAH